MTRESERKIPNLWFYLSYDYVKAICFTFSDFILCWYKEIKWKRRERERKMEKERRAHIRTYLIECLISDCMLYLMLRSLLLLAIQDIHWALDADQWTATPIKCIDAKMSIIIISYLSFFRFDIYICMVFVQTRMQARTQPQMRSLLYTLVEWSHAAHKCNPSSVILLLSFFFVFVDRIIILWHASKRQHFDVKTAITTTSTIHEVSRIITSANFNFLP